MKQESIFIQTKPSGNSPEIQEELHIRRFYKEASAPPVLMAHGSVENGKIFYSSSGKGFAPYLAENGFDVFVVDLRGRGFSKPRINKNSQHGLSEIIKEDFLSYINKVKEIKGDVPQHWVAHSWGGILMLAFLARNFSTVKIASMVFFGTRRRLTIHSVKKIWKIDFLWGLMARIAILFKGYIPAKEFKAGSDNETEKSFIQSNQWIRKKAWLDWDDQLDYAAVLQKLKLPPILHLIGQNDTLLAHPKDINLLINETGKQSQEIKRLGKSTGLKRDYGHNDILTHMDAPSEVYPIALHFMKGNSPQA